MRDVDYWDRFYAHDGLHGPSPFAVECAQRWISPAGDLVELGFGSGRDLHYFAARGLSVAGYDNSEEAVRLAAAACPDASCVCADFTRLPVGCWGNIYSRWTWHAITQEAESRLLTWVGRSLIRGGRVMIEARSIRDDLYGAGRPAGANAFVTSHYRRFIDPAELCGQLRALGLSIVHVREGRGLSPAGDSDPHLLRIVAEKREVDAL